MTDRSHNPAERITWLRFEFAEMIERWERREITLRQMGEQANTITTQAEINELGDELLRHAYWAITNAHNRPACWAPNSEEMLYLRRCLREEDVFDPDQVEFTISQR